MSLDGIAGRVAAVAVGVLALDQATKAIVRSLVERGEEVDLIAGVALVNVRNDGVAFGILGGTGALVIVITIVAAAGLLIYLATQPRRRGQSVAIGLLAGGAAGNVIDRIAAGEVTDFIDLPAWPAFNVADVAITAGIAVLVVTELWGDLGPGRSRS